MKDNNKVAELGENIVKSRLHNNPDFYINIQVNAYKERHFCDFSIQKWYLDKKDIKRLDRNFNRIDVKTYPPLMYYPGYTGINYKHFLEYLQDPDMIILFVDYQNEQIYGNRISKLQELYIDGEAVKIITHQKGFDNDDRIAWKISDMLNMNEIFGFNDEYDCSTLTETEVAYLYTYSKKYGI